MLSSQEIKELMENSFQKAKETEILNEQECLQEKKTVFLGKEVEYDTEHDDVYHGARSDSPVEKRKTHGFTGEDGTRSKIAGKIAKAVGLGGSLERARQKRSAAAEEEHQNRLALSKTAIEKHREAIDEHVKAIKEGRGNSKDHSSAIDAHNNAISKHSRFVHHGEDTLGSTDGFHGNDPHIPHKRAVEYSKEAFEKSKACGVGGLRESQLQEFLGFGGVGDHEKAAAHHEDEASKFQKLEEYHKDNGDHEHAAAYRAAAEAHSAAAAAHKTVIDGAKSSKINRSSSNDRKAAEEASRKANSIQTPKPTKGATQKAVTQRVWTSDHYYAGSVPDHHYKHIIQDGKPPTDEHKRAYLPTWWPKDEESK